LIVNDPYFPDQWNLQNPGPRTNQDQRGRVAGGDSAFIAESWQFILQKGRTGSVAEVGKDVRLAIIDDGFDLQHEEFAGKVVASANFGGPVLDNNLFSNSPRNFHGTLVTGIAAARANNGVGIAGACPGCQLILARMASEPPAGLTKEQYYDRIFDWVLKQKPDIINCSWGPGEADRSGYFEALVEKLTREGRGGKGVIVVAASGNDGGDLAQNNGLAAQPAVIAVGGSNSLGQRHSFGRTGPGLDLLAPTTGGGSAGKYVDRIFTTDNYLRPDCLKPGQKPSSGCSDQSGWSPQTPMAGGDGWEGRYSYRFSHTSAAAPLVSGVVGLMLAVNPKLTADEVQDILQQSADKIDAAAAQYDPSGFSPTHGFGRINALKAVQMAEQAL
jgi:subtilisin family serine protease